MCDCRGIREEMEVLKSGLCDVVQMLQFVLGFIESDQGLSEHFQAYKSTSTIHEQLATKAKTLNGILGKLNWRPEVAFSGVTHSEKAFENRPHLPVVTTNEHQKNSEATQTSKTSKRPNEDEDGKFATTNDSPPWKKLKAEDFKNDMVGNLDTLIQPKTAKYVQIRESSGVTTVKVSFGENKSVEATGSDFEKAKSSAAEIAVLSLIGETKFEELLKESLATEMEMEFLESSRNTVYIEKIPRRNEQEEFGMFIFKRVYEEFDKLENWPSLEEYLPHKVLAGIVVTRGTPLQENCRVISLASGTKWGHRQYLSQDGLSLSDCHAEILATRCARDFLYSQMDLLESPYPDERNDSILEHDSTNEGRQRYKLRADVKFHLYVSRHPCGGARMIDYSGKSLQNNFSSKSNDPLTVKNEFCGGTIPTDKRFDEMGESAVDLISPGNSIYRMSCYDKMCRWNVLGFQGALLHNLIGVVHFSTITFGVLNYPLSCTRFMHDRLSSLDSQLQSPFHVHEPELLTAPEPQHDTYIKTSDSPEHALCWTMGWNEPEVLVGNSGTCVYPDPRLFSKLSKKVLFQRYMKMKELGSQSQVCDVSYHDAKMEAVKYQETKEQFKNYFQEHNMGTWISNPVEDNLFMSSETERNEESEEETT